MTGDMRVYLVKISHVEGHNFEYWEAGDSQGIERDLWLSQKRISGDCLWLNNFKCEWKS